MQENGEFIPARLKRFAGLKKQIKKAQMNYIWLTIDGKLTKIECQFCKKEECPDHKVFNRLDKRMEIDTNLFLERTNAL